MVASLSLQITKDKKKTNQTRPWVTCSALWLALLEWVVALDDFRSPFHPKYLYDYTS